MASVDLIDLSKSYGDVEVLHALNLAIEDGEFLALVGPSGCGKSTLLRMIAGLEDITDGDIHMDGEWVNDRTPRERNVAMVFQSYALYPHMTVEENMGFNLRISRMAKADIKKRVLEAAEILNLEELLKRKPSQLSGGQRQRVAMGRALVRNPDIFLFDEPLSNLDAKLRVQMREEIKRLHQKVRTTSIYVTHDQIEAMTLADRIVILDGGRIQQIGTPTELYNNPANVFVAGFIGSPAMNFIDGHLKVEGKSPKVCFADGSKLDLANTNGLPDGNTVTIGLRPEHLELAGRGKSGKSLKGRVELIEPTGAQNHVKIAIAGQSITMVDSSLADLAIDDVVHVSIDPEKIHVFER